MKNPTKSYKRSLALFVIVLGLSGAILAVGVARAQSDVQTALKADSAQVIKPSARPEVVKEKKPAKKEGSKSESKLGSKSIAPSTAEIPRTSSPAPAPKKKPSKDVDDLFPKGQEPGGHIPFTNKPVTPGDPESYVGTVGQCPFYEMAGEKGCVPPPDLTCNADWSYCEPTAKATTKEGEN